MFDFLKIKRFRYQGAIGTDYNFEPNDKFIYAENEQDLIDLYGKQWEELIIENAENQIIIFAVPGKSLIFPNGHILILLQYLYKFRSYGIKDYDRFSHTYLGLTDISLSSASRTSQINSLLPHITVHDKIWINDLIMEGSPTYFIDLFDIQLWLAFFIIFSGIGILSTLGILLLRKFARYEIDNLNWYSILVNQGAVSENSSFVSRRFLLISLALVAVIFHGAFGAFMSSSLAVRYPDLPFSDIASLLNSPTYTVCVLQTTGAFEQLTYDAAKIVHPAKINSEECPNIFRQFDGTAISIDNAEKPCPASNMAYIGQGMCFFPEMTANCPMSAIRGKYFNEYITMVKYAGFKYDEQFNRGILLLRSSGHLNHIMQIHDLKVLHGTCSRRFIAPEPDIQVTFKQIQLLLAIILIGYLFSITLLVFELIYNTNLRDRLYCHNTML